MKSLLFFSILLFANCNSIHTNCDKQNSASVIYDTISIKNSDNKFIEEQKAANQKKLSKFKVQYKDSSYISVSTVSEKLKKELQGNVDLLLIRNATKNKEVFPFKEEFYALKNKKINLWLVIFIMILGGVIGGFARTKFHLLKGIITKADNALNFSSELKKNTLNSFENLSKKQTILEADIDEEKAKLYEIIEALKKEIEDIKKTVAKQEKKNLGVNIAFGIIASSFSFIVLTFTKPSVLEFKSPIDYLIFLSFCLLGALFAKKWIIALYEKINIK